MPFRCLWASRWCESCVRIPPARTRKSQGEVREVRAIFGREAVGRPQGRPPPPANGQLSVGRRHDLVREPNAGNPKERKMNSARKAATVVALGLASLAADAWDTGSEREVITEISKGYFHTCGIIRSNDSFESGSVKCWGDWGDDKYGQSTPPGGTFAQISAGWRHTCGLRLLSGEEWGSVECWDSRQNKLFIRVSAVECNSTPHESDPVAKKGLRSARPSRGAQSGTRCGPAPSEYSDPCASSCG